MATVRLTRAAITLFLAFAGSSARAGDFAERDIIGFSPDGAYFAFEEYGVQDGSGFPYANVYVIDTNKDAWVTGTPKRIRIDDEQASLADARGEARRQADALIQRSAIGAQGWVVATNRYTHDGSDPYKVTFRPRPVAPPIDDAMTLTLERFDLPGEQVCSDIGKGATKGFRLTLTAAARSLVLNEDKQIPGSRFCPLDYRIHDVVTFYPLEGGPVTIAVIVQMITPGFEGLDARFLAVTARLDR